MKMYYFSVFFGRTLHDSLRITGFSSTFPAVVVSAPVELLRNWLWFQWTNQPKDEVQGRSRHRNRDFMKFAEISFRHSISLSFAQFRIVSPFSFCRWWHQLLLRTPCITAARVWDGHGLRGNFNRGLDWQKASVYPSSCSAWVWAYRRPRLQQLWHVWAYELFYLGLWSIHDGTIQLELPLQDTRRPWDDWCILTAPIKHHKTNDTD